MLTFAYPEVFALLVLAWLIRTVVPPRHTVHASVRVPFGDRIQQAIGQTGLVQKVAPGRLRLVVPLLIWLLVLTALARPQWLEELVTRDQPTRDLLLLVDLSSSMSQEDFIDASGTQVDRLAAVKEVLGEFLIRREGDRVGLVVFGDSAFLQAPFSTDLNLSRQLLDETAIGMAGPRTALGDAIGLGVTLFEQSDAPAKTIIALTDGNDTKSQVPPVEAARIASDRDIRIHTVAIGDPTTAGEDKLDEEALRNVATTAQGSCFFAADREQLENIYDELDQIETREVNVISHRPRRDLFYWPLLAALLVSLGTTAFAFPRQRRTSEAPNGTASIRVDPRNGRLEVRE
jgi:Ca-activated chloride channel homolog